MSKAYTDWKIDQFEMKKLRTQLTALTRERDAAVKLLRRNHHAYFIGGLDVAEACKLDDETVLFLSVSNLKATEPGREGG